VICNQYVKNLNPKVEYCEIDRVNALFKSQALNKILNFPFFLNPKFLFRILASIIKFKPDYIHAHDLPMVPMGLFFGKIFRLPVVFDMHENYPEALKAFQKKGLLNFIFKNYKTGEIINKRLRILEIK